MARDTGAADSHPDPIAPTLPERSPPLGDLNDEALLGALLNGAGRSAIWKQLGIRSAT